MHRSLQILSALSLLTLSSAAMAQDQTPEAERPIKVGMFGAGAYNIHEGAFATYDGVLQCGAFEKAETLEWQAGNVIDFPIGESFGLSTRLYYHKANGDFTSPNATSPYVSLADGSLVRMQSEQVLVSALDYVMLEALGRWDVVPNVYIGAGPAVGLATRAAYEQEERIVSPSGLTFINGGTSRTIVAGNFEEQGSGEARRNLRLAATAVIGADIPVSDRFYLNPEAGFTLPFTNVLSSFDWKVSVVRAGIGIKYALRATPPPPPAPVDAPPPVASRPAPVVALDLASRKSDGTELNGAELVVAEERASDVMPLLPYVFFAPQSDEIPARYRRLAGNTAGFNEKDLDDSTLGVYHHLLNIIGERMRRYPEATITVTGCRETADEKQAALGSARAAVVKQYLVETWGIDAGRIGTEQRGLPTVISNRAIDDGREENRRAEITSSDARVLAPVEINRVAGTIEPASVTLLPRVQFGESITGWNATVIDNRGAEVWGTRGTGSPNAPIVWPVDGPSVAPRAAATPENQGWRVRLRADVAEGGAIDTEREIPVRHVVRFRRINGEIVNDSLLERYGLMFFDFNTPKISDFNSETIKLIQSRMRTNSAVRITGLTDRTGDADYNLALSKSRAQATAEKIKARILPESLGTTGAGEMLIYNNDLPEGRFYNRTVVIEIATPVEK